ncbi:hypothetical protein Tco_0849910 [Tanacetum coccineum]
MLERFYTSAGNPVKDILLKLNLPEHRILKDGGEVKEFQRSFRHSDIERLSRSDEVLKLKNFKKDATLKLFKIMHQERRSRSHSRQVKEQAQDLKSMITTSNHKSEVEEAVRMISSTYSSNFHNLDFRAYDHRVLQGGGGGGVVGWLVVSVLFMVMVLIVELEVLIVELFVDLFVGLFVVVFVEENWSHGAERKDGFVKCDMTRNDNFVGVHVKAPVSAMIVRVPEKDRGCEMVDKIEEEPNQEHDKKTWSRLQSWKPTFRKDEPIMPTETILIEEVPLLTRIWSRIHNGGPVVHKDTPIITTESIRTEDVPLLTSFQDDYAGVTPLPTMVFELGTYKSFTKTKSPNTLLGVNWDPCIYGDSRAWGFENVQHGRRLDIEASFVSYTISLAAFIGIVVLIVLASLH